MEETEERRWVSFLLLLAFLLLLLLLLWARSFFLLFLPSNPCLFFFYLVDVCYFICLLEILSMFLICNHAECRKNNRSFFLISYLHFMNYWTNPPRSSIFKNVIFEKGRYLRTLRFITQWIFINFRSNVYLDICYTRSYLHYHLVTNLVIRLT